MKVKISGTFEGKCNFCKKEGIVFTLGDEDTHRIVTICKECSAEKGSESVSVMIEKHGKKNDKVFEPGVRHEGKKIAGNMSDNTYNHSWWSHFHISGYLPLF